MPRKSHPDPSLVEIGTLVRERRKANRMTQAELAALAGVGVRFVSDLENGKTTLRIETVNAVLQVFGRRLGTVPAEKTDRHPGPEDDHV
jgi:y4mF family transcriptional regulator